MHRHLITALMVLLVAARADGQVAVEILNMPTEVYSLEPVYVLYSVENVGRSPLYLPAERAPNGGHGVYVGRNGTPPEPVIWVTGDRLYPYAQNTMWLGPGERWLFYRDMGRKVGLLEGEATIQAVVSSDGHCGDDQRYGRQEFPLEPLHVRSFRVGNREANEYRCWQGEARSNAWTLRIRKANSPEDLRAHEYLLGIEGLRQNREEGYWIFGRTADLVEKFPKSHYAYADLVQQTSVYAQKKAVELQPDNRLNPWVMGKIAERVIQRRSRCSTDPPLQFDLDVEALELPEGVSEYLEQHRWWVEHRHCRKPNSSQGGQGGD